MLSVQREFLTKHGVTFGAPNDQIHFGFGKPRRVEMEAPCELRAGKFDAERIGAYTYVGGNGSIFRNVGKIGRYCSIAGGQFFGPVEHRVDAFSSHPIFEGSWLNKWPEVDQFYADNPGIVASSRAECAEKLNLPKIQIGNNVWIGEGVFIKQGVSIGDGAVIGARSVVTRDVEPYAVALGAPAETKWVKFPERIVEQFLALKWWDYELTALEGIQLTSVDVNSAEIMIDQIAENIHRRSLKPMQPRIVAVGEDGSCSVSE